MPDAQGIRRRPWQVRHHLLRTVRAWARLAGGVAGDGCAALHGEGGLPVQVGAGVRAVVLPGPRRHGQVLGRGARFPAARHGVAGAAWLVGGALAHEGGQRVGVGRRHCVSGAVAGTRADGVGWRSVVQV